jgi:hypothetical protein
MSSRYGAITFSIGGIAFAALSANESRCGLDFTPFSEEYDHSVFHVKGSYGNFLIRGGRTGRQCHALFCYLGSVSAVYGNFNADQADWANAALVIVDPGGNQVATRGRLMAGSFRKMGKVTPAGVGDTVRMNCEATFTKDD